jgi:hypothetical protein
MVFDRLKLTKDKKSHRFTEFSFDSLRMTFCKSAGKTDPEINSG